MFVILLAAPSLFCNSTLWLFDIGQLCGSLRNVTFQIIIVCVWFLWQCRVIFWLIDDVELVVLIMYLQDLTGYNVKVLVRCCEPSYGIEPLTEAGIKVVVSVTYLHCGSLYHYFSSLSSNFRISHLKMGLPLPLTSYRSGWSW